jgi:hypothetical protein
MRLTLKNDFTEEIIVVNNVKSFTVVEDGTRVFTEANGSKDMTTYRCWFVIGAEREGV